MFTNKQYSQSSSNFATTLSNNSISSIVKYYKQILYLKAMDHVSVISFPFKYFTVVLPIYYTISILFPKETTEEIKFIGKKSSTISFQYECHKIQSNVEVKAKYTVLLIEGDHYYMVSESLIELPSKSIISDKIKISMPIKGV